MTKTVTKQSSLNFRLDAELAPMITEWLEKNPGFTSTQLGNLALRNFVTKPYQLEPVSVAYMTKQEFNSVTERVMERHADALERLK